MVGHGVWSYNAPSTFQRTTDMIFDDMLHFTKVYMDDIVVHSKSWAEHLENVKAVLQRLRDSKIFVNRSKCEFVTEEIDFVGFRVFAMRVRTQPEKLQALLKCHIPKDVADVMSFTGFTNF